MVFMKMNSMLPPYQVRFVEDHLRSQNTFKPSDKIIVKIHNEAMEELDKLMEKFPDDVSMDNKKLRAGIARITTSTEDNIQAFVRMYNRLLEKK